MWLRDQWRNGIGTRRRAILPTIEDGRAATRIEAWSWKRPTRSSCMTARVEQYICERVPRLPRLGEDVDMVAVPKDSTAPFEQSVEPARQPHLESLQGSPEAALVLCL